MTKPEPTHLHLPIALAKEVRAILGRMPYDQIGPTLEQWAKCPMGKLTLPEEVPDAPPTPAKAPQIASVPDTASGDPAAS